MLRLFVYISRQTHRSRVINCHAEGHDVDDEGDRDDADDRRRDNRRCTTIEVSDYLFEQITSHIAYVTINIIITDKKHAHDHHIGAHMYNNEESCGSAVWQTFV